MAESQKKFRRPKGAQDTNSFQAFLSRRATCGCRGGMKEHLRRHHRGLTS